MSRIHWIAPCWGPCPSKESDGGGTGGEVSKVFSLSLSYILLLYIIYLLYIYILYSTLYYLFLFIFLSLSLFSLLFSFMHFFCCFYFQFSAALFFFFLFSRLFEAKDERLKMEVELLKFSPRPRVSCICVTGCVFPFRVPFSRQGSWRSSSSTHGKMPLKNEWRNSGTRQGDGNVGLMFSTLLSCDSHTCFALCSSGSSV